MQVCCNTDRGQVREQNQDSVFATENPVGKLSNLLMVADGMGGHKAGDYASRFAVNKIVERIGESPYENPLLIVEDAIRSVNRMIYNLSRDNEDLRGMGTTLTLCFTQDDRLHVFQIGDSRLYIVRKGSIRQVTNDHSYVEEMYRKGLISKNSEEYRTKKNIITRALGALDYVGPDVFEEDIRPGDIVLLCSDGLTNMLEDSVICGILCREDSLENKADTLIREANRQGGQDNISVVLGAV